MNKALLRDHRRSEGQLGHRDPCRLQPDPGASLACPGARGATASLCWVWQGACSAVEAHWAGGAAPGSTQLSQLLTYQAAHPPGADAWGLDSAPRGTWPPGGGLTSARPGTSSWASARQARSSHWGRGRGRGPAPHRRRVLRQQGTWACAVAGHGCGGPSLWPHTPGAWCRSPAILLARPGSLTWGPSRRLLKGLSGPGSRGAELGRPSSLPRQPPLPAAGVSGRRACRRRWAPTTSC